jgi:hypothetical protein
MADALFTGTAKELTFQIARIADTDDRVFDVVEHKEKRSLSQNSYYWVLVGKVADKLRISKSRLHNDMLRHYGQRMIVDDKPVIVYIPDTEESENAAMESDTVHLKMTSSVLEGNNGITYRAYVMMRGSHDYNSSEMSVLVSGIVEEAKQIGIETLTPEQLYQMQQLEQQAEERRYAQKN